MNQEEDGKNARIKSSSNVDVINPPAVFPLVDAHMHIQSNDIAPLPIMNGILRYKTALKFLPKGFINYIFLSSREIPNFKYDYDPRTDIIYEGEKKLYNVNLFRGTPINRPEVKNRRFLTDATAFITEYGVVTRHCSYSIAGLYVNEAILTALAYPSRWSSASVSKKWDEKLAKKSMESIVKARHNQDWFDQYIGWYENSLVKELKTNENKEVSAFVSKPELACMMGMELMYSHFWGAYGIPIYLEDSKGTFYTIENFPNYICTDDINGGNNTRTTINTLNYPYDMKLPAENETGYIDLTNCNKKQIFTGQKYSLFLREIDKSETYRFEDHLRHTRYQKIASLRYPFQFIPFYHVDPRRFFAPIGKMEEIFDFYVPTERTGIYKREDSIIKNIKKEINGRISFGNSFNYSISENLLKNDLLWNNKRQLGTGLFWGVKLYVALGYPPYIGCSGNITGRRIFPKLDMALENKENSTTVSYQRFTEFLNWCGENDIPITCHGSPQGMTIADSEIYLKEYLKQNGNSKFSEMRTSEFEPHCKGMMLGLGLIDDFSSPESWKVVLEQISSKDLRLCLAHFGGKPYFVDEYSMENDPYAWQIKLKNLIYTSNKKIYTDLSNFMFRKVYFPNVVQENAFDKILKKYSEAKELFTEEINGGTKYYRSKLIIDDLNVYKINDCEQYKKRQQALRIRFAMLETGIVGADINKAATKLAKLFEDDKNNLLRYRIMFGSDYPMFEGTDGVKGVADYQSSTFIFYQLLTHKLNNKWDAWHQFTVINPLIFIGLIQIDDTSEAPEYFTIQTAKLNQFKSNLQVFNNSDDLCNDKEREKFYDLDSRDDVNAKFSKINIDAMYKNLKIPRADKIIDKDGNLIITGEKCNAH